MWPALRSGGWRVAQASAAGARAPRLLERGLFGEDEVHALIVGLAGQLVHELAGEGDADAQGAGAALGEQPIVVAAAATEAQAGAGEGHARDEDRIEVGGCDPRAAGEGRGVEVPVGAGEQGGIFHTQEHDLFAAHLWKAEYARAFHLPERLDLGLAREREKGGDAPGRGPLGHGEEGRAEAGRGRGEGRAIGGSQPFADGLAEFGFGHAGSTRLRLRTGKRTNPWRGARRLYSPAVPNPFSRPGRKKSEIKKSPPPPPVERPEGAAQRVGLKPQKDWHKRNFFTEVLIPSLFAERAGQPETPEFPALGESEIGVTWIGHASFLIQTQGHNLLIDPNWARWLKVIKRVRHPGLRLHELPSIDLVLVTHAHFDHLDRKTLRTVAADQPIVVPYEVGNLVHDLGFHTVHELHHWETFEHGPVRITLTPAQHWGARVLHDSHRGFGGFIIEVGGRTIYHCGDTAYFPGFEEIGRRYQIDLALLPIGAYDPPSGREVHMNPEEALEAFVALGAKQMVPMHYGSFRLSYEPLDEPPERLMLDARQKGLDDRIVVMREGVPMVF